MKNCIKILFVAGVILTSCTNKNAKESNAEELTKQQTEEIQKIENLTEEIEQETKDMDQTAKELDAALEEINE